MKTDAKQPVFEAKKIVKNYGKVQALKDVDFSIYEGEVVGLLGDNGAGKSTLIKIFSGALPFSSGELFLDRETCRFNTPQDARDLGIETVYQDLALASDLDIESNVFLGREILRPGILGKLGFLDKRKMQSHVKGIFQNLNITIRSVQAKISDLSGGQRQAVAVSRAVSWGTKLIIMDEPTAALGVEQSAMVLDLIRKVKSKKIPVIFISHTLPFVFDVCDRIVVLRLGEVVADVRTSETSVDEVVQYITGSKTVNENITRLQRSKATP
jgi:ABC-type sugar transport system ATPase subunit